jgi:hypothetical protein
MFSRTNQYTRRSGRIVYIYCKFNLKTVRMRLSEFNSISILRRLLVLRLSLYVVPFQIFYAMVGLMFLAWLWGRGP